MHQHPRQVLAEFSQLVFLGQIPEDQQPSFNWSFGPYTGEIVLSAWMLVSPPSVT